MTRTNTSRGIVSLAPRRRGAASARRSARILGSSLAAVVGLGLAPGCYEGPPPGGDGDSDGGAGDGDGDGTGGAEAELPAPSTRTYRLTHTQWENTIRDLFQLDAPTGFSEAFRADPRVAGFVFDNNAESLEVDQALWSGYQRAAAQIGNLLESDPAIVERISPPDTGDVSARGRAFVESFGRRAFRRPLSADEIEAHVGLFEQGPDLYEATDPYVAGVRFVVEAMLQSPFFLYRVERSTAVVDGVIPLDGWEVAQRMSYFLWDTMPDDQLLGAAEMDALTDPSGVESEALRMLADPRAEAVVTRFHDQLHEVEDFEAIAPSPAFFPDVSERLGEFATTEHELFVRDVIFGRNGTLADLLTSTRTFVNADLATAYGLDGTFGDEFEPVSLDPAERRGIFTQVGFLGANATSVNPDPIHRGVFLAKRVACLTIAAPPDGVPPLPPSDPSKTNRELVEGHTEANGTVCASCHRTLINPFGFPFESYDAVGAYRTEDNGFPVDTATEIRLGADTIPVTGALDMLDVLAQRPEVHACYLKHWVEFAAGRPSAPQDAALVDRLAVDSNDQAAPIVDILVDLVTSRPFLARSQQELP